jgi:hypothetical protein
MKILIENGKGGAYISNNLPGDAGASWTTLTCEVLRYLKREGERQEEGEGE